MIKTRILLFIRDICLFLLLSTLVIIAFKRAYWLLLKHKKTLVHELDRTFLHQLHATKKQMRNVTQLTQTKQCYEHMTQELTTLATHLARIEKKYTKNSPGIMLLGPIGTTSIILKEAQLTKELLTNINNLGKILHNTTNRKTEFHSAATIDDGLKNNREYIRELIQKTNQ